MVNPGQDNAQAEPLAIVLAAGRGTRMGGDRPKVLYEAAGKPLVRWVLDALAEAGVSRRIVVVGYHAADVEAALEGIPGVSFVTQKEQKGTGDAVAAASAEIAGAVRDAAGDRLPVLIVTGDSPMLQPTSVRKLLQAFSEEPVSCLLGTAITESPEGLGRVVRDERGRFLRIVEQKDASDAECGIREVNMSTYLFEGGRLLWALGQLDTSNASGEYYLTDCPGLLQERGERVEARACLEPCERLSVNTPEELAIVANALAARTA
jgi:bifunctional UDP-N-acetylglucosamine pyrophosphorylase/glucosamine-1-phosphate N-acetyltransferase